MLQCGGINITPSQERRAPSWGTLPLASAYGIRLVRPLTEVTCLWTRREGRGLVFMTVNHTSIAFWWGVILPSLETHSKTAGIAAKLCSALLSWDPIQLPPLQIPAPASKSRVEHTWSPSLCRTVRVYTPYVLFSITPYVLFSITLLSV